MRKQALCWHKNVTFSNGGVHGLNAKLLLKDIFWETNTSVHDWVYITNTFIHSLFISNPICLKRFGHNLGCFGGKSQENDSESSWVISLTLVPKLCWLERPHKTNNVEENRPKATGCRYRWNAAVSFSRSHTRPLDKTQQTNCLIINTSQTLMPAAS